MRYKRALHKDAAGDGCTWRDYSMLKKKLRPPMHRVERRRKETACIGE